MNTTRREMLAAAGALGAAGFAGCLGEDTANQAGVGGDDGDSRLAYLRVANEDNRDHTVHLLVQRDGEPVHWSSHDLAAGNDRVTSRTIEQSWVGASGEVTVYFRLDGADEWDSFDIDDGRGDCYGAMAKVDGDGEFGVWFQKDPPACERTPTATSE
ncbi:hypothetical protein HUG10_10550 [Halorarum halophilum]|uniref:Uncharacterized protein n=1 Tax=Halorarum halophilum TaxID=2743090 RepID=A0A7D5GXS9_9EURY|nr:hypothetical protein [Halobaculum halophilum]QLG27969.1 hypothetical protein HUG10_10550 [Halobaculum halophilum]